jgi:hypothetical protein
MEPMDKYKQQLDREISKRGLVSLMNNTKWAELQEAVVEELPFCPPYQRKLVLSSLPDPEHFESDVDYFGDWSDEGLTPFYQIEWLRVRPRFLEHRGQLIAPEVQSIQSEFLQILRRYHIPHRCEDNIAAIWIYGYARDTSEIIRSS